MASRPGIDHTIKETSAVYSFSLCLNEMGATRFSFTRTTVLLSPKRTNPGLWTRLSLSLLLLRSTSSELTYEECKAPESKRVLPSTIIWPSGKRNSPSLCTLFATSAPTFGANTARRSCDRSVSSINRSCALAPARSLPKSFTIEVSTCALWLVSIAWAGLGYRSSNVSLWLAANFDLPSLPIYHCHVLFNLSSGAWAYLQSSPSEHSPIT